MKSTVKKEFTVTNIKQQFNELESVANEFAEKIEKLKQQQEDFERFMKDKNLLH